MSTWYYIGPDKTGFDCSDCCAGFSSVGGSCVPASCSIVGSLVRRNYVCPSTTFPSPFHYYFRNATTGNVAVSLNPIKCPSGVDPACGYFTPELNTLNSGGRAGSGCSQSWVSWTSGQCQSSSSSCPACDAECGYTQSGALIYNKYCSINGSSCSCVDAGSTNTCQCVCVQEGGCCSPDPESPCYCGETPCILCPDGTYACFGAECACGGSPIPTCNSCQSLECIEGTSYSCVEKSCGECSSGYICSSSGAACGTCVCNSSSTCCVGEFFGFRYDSSSRTCRSCGYDPSGSYPTSSSSCCRAVQKGCSNATQKCCADGLCYSSATTLCPIT